MSRLEDMRQVDKRVSSRLVLVSVSHEGPGGFDGRGRVDQGAVHVLPSGKGGRKGQSQLQRGGKQMGEKRRDVQRDRPWD